MEASNVKEIREALETICNAIIVDGHTAKMSLSLFDISNIAKSALAALPRNCDVGAAEEQVQRFKDFCLPRVGKCSENGTCPARYPLNKFGVPYCQLKWAQLPYEAPQEGNKP